MTGIKEQSAVIAPNPESGEEVSLQETLEDGQVMWVSRRHAFPGPKHCFRGCYLFSSIFAVGGSMHLLEPVRDDSTMRKVSVAILAHGDLDQEVEAVTPSLCLGWRIMTMLIRHHSWEATEEFQLTTASSVAFGSFLWWP